MNVDDLTPPEKSAQRRQAKRYKVAIEKRGLCCACKHRDRSSAPFGINHCRLKVERRYPTCDRDGREPKFQFDETVLGEFKDAA